SAGREYMEQPPDSSERIIAVHSLRNRLIVSIVLCILIIVGFFFLMRLAYNAMLSEATSSFPFSLLSILDLVLLLLELIAVFLFAGSTVYNIRRLTSHEATLIIDTEGITIRGYFPLGNIRLLWADVAEIFGRSPS